MALPVFPINIMPPITPGEEPEDPGISSQMEDGTVLSRARFTKSRLTFSLRWGDSNDNPLTTDEKDTLLNFYRDIIKGSSQRFTWYCNAKNSSFYGEEFTVRCINPPKFNEICPGFWSGTMTLQEA